eukprot:Transcript_8592.p1 GENE.Transcript_8592~~Transcript_8592.p1  ORF type:complete len:751 (-),score=399.68 Transcript_8592:248-2416(-)
MTACLPELPKATGQSGFRVLGSWPDLRSASTLDETQVGALKACLTREVALVHGAPGTGKTTVTTLALKALLANAAKRGRGAATPVLLVCANSGALDRVLEAVVEQHPKLVRVGPRSASDALRGTSLRQRIAEEKEDEAEAKARRALAKQQCELRAEIEALAAQLQQREPTADDVEEVANTAQIMSLCAAPDGWLDIEQALELWLQPVRDAAQERTAELLLAGGGGPQRRLVTGGEEGGGARGAKKEEPKRLVRAAGNRMADWAAVTRIEFAEADREADEQWEEELVLTRGGDAYLRAEAERMVDVGGRAEEEGGTVVLGRPEAEEWPDEEAQEALLEHDELWQLDAAERGTLCMLLVHQKNEALYAKLSQLSERYEKLAFQKQQLDAAAQLSALKKAPLVGMTAAALGKLSAVVNALECEVVLVEGAEQVLESHVLVALSSQTHHLILTGDRTLPRHSTPVARLAKQFRLDVSMLDRLGNNGVDCVTLGYQRRMRPQIARLLTPIYERILGADRPPPGGWVSVRGIERSLFFLQHEKPEALEAETRSRSNPHEAKFVAALAAYLLRQGYEPKQLALLTPYCGQQLLLRRELHEQSPGASDVLVTTVEQFAGEQADIVLLSLVRSNGDKEIGSLSVDSRVADALSRARYGLYIVGNAKLLGAESTLWESVVRLLKQDGAIGDFLPLIATRGETGRHALARSAEDFVDIATDYERQQQQKRAAK